MIEMRGVTFSYPGQEKPVLKDIDFKVTPGEFLVVLGRNGSGKSTLARLMNGLLLPTSGSVLIEGISTSNRDLRRSMHQKAGLLLSNPENQLVSTIVEEDVAFGPENLGMDPGEIEYIVQKALALVSMEDYRKYPPHLLSGGQKQRVAIAGILALQPDYMILDEPTSMLDPSGRQEIMGILKRLNMEENKTIIHITHFVEEALEADRVMVLGDGRVFMDGPPTRILTRTNDLNELGLESPELALLVQALKDRGFDLPPLLTEREWMEYLTDANQQR